MKRVELVKKDSKPGIFINNNRYILLSFFTSLLVFLIIAISYKIIPFGDITILRMDLYHQYGPLLAEAYDRITHGDLSVIYSFYTGGGGSFLGNFYNYLSSPISILCILLFGHKNMPIAIYEIICIKIALSAAFEVYYFKKSPRFGKHNYLTAGFGLLYAFSGYFVAYYWNIMWIDGMMLLPLCVLGLEYLIENRSPWLYCGSFALLLVSSYYMAYMVAIFLVMYFIEYTFTKHYESIKEVLRPLGKAVLYAAISGLLSAFSLLPTYFALRSCSATSGTFPKEMATYFTFFDFVANHFANLEPTIRSSGDVVLPNIYCGIITIILFVLFFYTKTVSIREKIGSICMVAVLFASFNINFLNYIWHGFHFPNDLPYRQSFVYIFFLLTIAFRAITKLKEISNRDLLQVGIITVLFIIITEKVGSANFTSDSAIVSLIAVIVYVSVLYLLRSPERSKKTMAAAMFCVMFAEMTIADINNFDIDVTNSSYTGAYEEMKDAESFIYDYDDSDLKDYRIETTYSIVCMNPAWYGYRGISSFSSMAYEKSANLQQNLGIAGNYINSYTYKLQTPVYNSMMGLKYIIDNDPAVNVSTDYFEQIGHTDNTTIYKNRYWLPMAYSANTSVIDWLYSDVNPFVNQNNFYRAATGLDTDVLEPIHIDSLVLENLENVTDDLYTGSITLSKLQENLDAKVTFKFEIPKTQHVYLYPESRMADTITIHTEDGSFYKETTMSTDNQYVIDLGIQQEGTTLLADVNLNEPSGIFDIYAAGLNDEAFKEAYGVLNDSGVMKIDEFKDTYIKGTVEIGKDEMLYTSINFDEGWNVFVDGQKVGPEDIYKLGGALIGVEMPEGSHTVEFKFKAKGLTPGIAVSSVTALAVIAWFVYKRKK